MRIIPSITLNVDGSYYPSGIAVDVDDEIAENAISLGLAVVAPEPEPDVDAVTPEPEPDVEEAVIEAPEAATTTRAKRKR